MRNETTDLQSRLNAARAEAAQAAAAVDAARQALAADVLSLTPADFSARRAKLATLEQTAATLSDRVKAMEAALAEAERRARVARVTEIATRLKELSKQGAEAAARYRAAAQSAWQAAEEIARIGEAARDLEAEALRGWSDELAEQLGRCPRLTPPLPDLARLHLPAAAPDGTDLIDARGVDLVAAAIERRQRSAAATAWLSGVRQGAKLAGR
jgi:chromosome segregation ATPase